MSRVKKEYIVKNQEVIILNGLFFRVRTTRYLNKSGLLHRDDDKPAYIAKVGNKTYVEEWYQNNKLSRKRKPPRVEYYK